MTAAWPAVAWLVVMLFARAVWRTYYFAQRPRGTARVTVELAAAYAEWARLEEDVRPLAAELRSYSAGPYSEAFPGCLYE